METLGYLLGAITIIWIWDTKLRDELFFLPQEDDEVGFKPKEYRIKLFRVVNNLPLFGKLINCATCLTFWVGLISFIITKDLFLLSLPIFYKLTIKLITK